MESTLLKKVGLEPVSVYVNDGAKLFSEISERYPGSGPKILSILLLERGGIPGF